MQLVVVFIHVSGGNLY